MADITLRCPNCGENTTVSEYIDPSMAECRSCGQALEVPFAELLSPQKAPQEEKSAQSSQRGVLASKPSAAVTADSVVGIRDRKRRRKRKKLLVWTPNRRTVWIIFFSLTAVLALLRFVVFSDLDSMDGKVFKSFGILAMLVMHMTVVVDGFRDNVMHGLLCLFVPFYSIYFVFLHSDSFLLRIMIAALGLVFGLDTTLFLYHGTRSFLTWLGGSELLSEGF
jgi:hypothetical protein